MAAALLPRALPYFVVVKKLEVEIGIWCFVGRYGWAANHHKLNVYREPKIVLDKHDWGVWNYWWDGASDADSFGWLFGHVVDVKQVWSKHASNKWTPPGVN